MSDRIANTGGEKTKLTAGGCEARNRFYCWGWPRHEIEALSARLFAIADDPDKRALASLCHSAQGLFFDRCESAPDVIRRGVCSTQVDAGGNDFGLERSYDLQKCGLNFRLVRPLGKQVLSTEE